MSHYKFNCGILSSILSSFQKALEIHTPKIQGLAKGSPHFAYYLNSTLPQVFPSNSPNRPDGILVPKENPFWPSETSLESLSGLKGVKFEQKEENWAVLTLDDGRKIELVGLREGKEEEALKKMGSDGDWGVILVEDAPFELHEWNDKRGLNPIPEKSLKKEVLEGADEIQVYIHRFLEDNILYSTDPKAQTVSFQFRPKTHRLHPTASASLRFGLSQKSRTPRLYFGDLSFEEHLESFRHGKSLQQMKEVFQMVNYFNLIERINIGLHYQETGCTACNPSLKFNEKYPRDFFDVMSGSMEVRMEDKHQNLSRVIHRMLLENPNEKSFLVVFSQSFLGEIAKMISSAVVHGSSSDLPSLRMRKTLLSAALEKEEEEPQAPSTEDLEIQAICDVLHQTASAESVEVNPPENCDKSVIPIYLKFLEQYGREFSFDALAVENPSLNAMLNNSQMCSSFDIFFGEIGNSSNIENDTKVLDPEIRQMMEKIKRNLEYKVAMKERKLKLRETHLKRFGKR